MDVDSRCLATATASARKAGGNLWRRSSTAESTGRGYRGQSDGSNGSGLVFDHISKTGGLAITEAMRLSLPPDSLSPHLNPYDRAFPTTEYSRWPHLAGHFGRRFRSMLPHFETRLTATVVREPVARIVSCYTYWRFNIADASSRQVELAQKLGFSDFIRSPDSEINLFDDQVDFLGGDRGRDPTSQAEELLDRYKIVGITDDLPRFLDRVLEAVGCESSPPASELLAKVPSNASLRSIEICEEDRAYIAAHQPFDTALYSAARRRSSAE